MFSVRMLQTSYHLVPQSSFFKWMGPLYQPRWLIIDVQSVNEKWQGKPKNLEKTCPTAILSTTNPLWPDLGSNPARRGGKPTTNRLSYGSASTTSIADKSVNQIWALSKWVHSFAICILICIMLPDHMPGRYRDMTPESRNGGAWIDVHC
jgi:hypothetical protein